MKQPNTNMVYTAALYLRLSKDDGIMDKDSASIDTQRDLLTRYCNDNNIIIYDYYVDDGFTGLNTDRPAFKRMIEDAEAKRINCVITKDQSRLGRNHLESGFYMEVYFPEHGIRYIALNDNVDTINAATLDIAPFRNLLNDMYSQDISKKVKSALYIRQSQGKFIGNKAPFGYLKDPNDKNHLVIDERYAPTVRRIYELYLDGNGVHKIARILREKSLSSLLPLLLSLLTHILPTLIPMKMCITGVTELFPLFSQIPYMQDISEDSKDLRYQPRARKDTQEIQKRYLLRICTSLSLNPKNGSLFRALSNRTGMRKPMTDMTTYLQDFSGAPTAVTLLQNRVLTEEVPVPMLLI